MLPNCKGPKCKIIKIQGQNSINIEYRSQIIILEILCHVRGSAYFNPRSFTNKIHQFMQFGRSHGLNE